VSVRFWHYQEQIKIIRGHYIRFESIYIHILPKDSVLPTRTNAQSGDKQGQGQVTDFSATHLQIWSTGARDAAHALAGVGHPHEYVVTNKQLPDQEQWL
jgi:hypothetical protein